MYDSNQGAITTALTNTSTAVFTESTINSILALVSTDAAPTIVVDTVTPANGVVTAAAGTELVFVTLSDTVQTTVTVNADIPVVFFQGAGGVDATFNSPTAAGGHDPQAAPGDPQGAPGDAIARFIVGTAGADKITILDSKNTQVIAGGGDTVTAGSGHTIVVAAEGSSTVVGGGDTIVQAVGSDEDFTVTAEGGHAVIANATTGVTVDISKAQFVQLDGNDALIFAANTEQAAVANLYQAIFGRTADAGGLDYWFDIVDTGADIGHIATVFLASTEYTGDDQTNAEFIAALYQHALGRAADAAGAEYWTGVLTAGAERGHVAAVFAVAAANHVELNEVNVVGSVTVVEGIVA